MPISEIASVITYTAAPSMLQFLQTGVMNDADFAISNKPDVTKQIQFNASALTANSSVTLAAPAIGTSPTITLPSATGTLAMKSDLLVQTVVAAQPTEGGTVTIAAGTQIQALAPAGNLSAITATLPSAPPNGTTITICCALHNIAAITVSSAGSDTVNNPPTALSAGQFAQLTYVTGQTAWFRTG